MIENIMQSEQPRIKRLKKKMLRALKKHDTIFITILAKEMSSSGNLNSQESSKR
jgi:hypothetical protein